MSIHPYWAYGPDAATAPEEYAQAVEEGRRACALELAVKSFGPACDILSLADTFVAYLKTGEGA